MSIKFYAGVHPQQKLFLSNGSAIRWTDVGRDEGIFATDVEFVQKELAAMIRDGRGGVSEITAEQYAQKKTNRSVSGTANFREEMSRAGYRVSPLANPNLMNPSSIPARLQSEDAAAAASVSTDPIIVPTVKNLQVPLPTDLQMAQESAAPVARKKGPGRPRKNA